MRFVSLATCLLAAWSTFLMPATRSSNVSGSMLSRSMVASATSSPEIFQSLTGKSWRPSLPGVSFVILLPAKTHTAGARSPYPLMIAHSVTPCRSHPASPGVSEVAKPGPVECFLRNLPDSVRQINSSPPYDLMGVEGEATRSACPRVPRPRQPPRHAIWCETRPRSWSRPPRKGPASSPGMCR